MTQRNRELARLMQAEILLAHAIDNAERAERACDDLIPDDGIEDIGQACERMRMVRAGITMMIENWEE